MTIHAVHHSFERQTLHFQVIIYDEPELFRSLDIMKAVFTFLVIVIFSFGANCQYSVLDALSNRITKDSVNLELKKDLILQLYAEADRMTSLGRPYPIEDIQTGNERLRWATDWVRIHGNHEDLITAQYRYYTHLVYSSQGLESILIGKKLIRDSVFLASDWIEGVLGTLRSTYINYGDYIEAIGVINVAFAVIKEKEGIRNALYDKHSYMANIYYELKLYERAIIEWEQALKEYLQTDSPDSMGVSSIYNNIGLGFGKIENRDSSRLYFEKALEHIPFNEDSSINKISGYNQYFSDIIQSNIAKIDFSRDNFIPLLTALENEINSAQLIDDFPTYLDAWNSMAEIYFIRGEYTKAMHFLELSESQALSSNQFPIYIKNNEIRNNVLIATGKIDEARVLHNRLTYFKDSLNSERAARQIQYAKIVFIAETQEARLKEQENALQANQRELEIQKKWRNVYIIFAVVLIPILALLLFLYRQVRLQHKEVTNSLRNRDLLIKEVHHRVKNNLQIISNLLEIQGRSLNDERYKDIMSEGQNRVKSMALIHETLYKTDNFESVFLYDYVNKLVKNIYISNQERICPVEICIDKIQFSIHLDLAVPIGLILNELLTNCFKHAFVDRDSGNIWVKFAEKDNRLTQIKVIDDGIGMPVGFRLDTIASLGLEMVKGLTWQLNAKIYYECVQNKTVFVLDIADISE